MAQPSPPQLRRGLRWLILILSKRPLGLRSTADEIGGVIDAARALVFGDLRIRTQRTRAVHLAVGAVGRDQLVRRHALFHPALKRADFIEYIGTFTAAAVAHSGLQE